MATRASETGMRDGGMEGWRDGGIERQRDGGIERRREREVKRKAFASLHLPSISLSLYLSIPPSL
ncbi:MAG TPA: hypothetical protein VGK99_24270, partial [Acidobacteriota bacterium]